MPAMLSTEFGRGVQQQPAIPGQLNTSGSAADMASSVLAAEMANWETQYKPVELNLLNQSSLNNPNVLPDAINNATTTAEASNTAMQGIQQRQLASRGIVATQGQQMAMDRLSNLSGAANVAGARNQARQNVATQDELIALGTAPSPNIVQQSANSKYSGS